MDTKVKTSEYSWADIVNTADPTRHRATTAYLFSNGRRFTCGAAARSSESEVMLLTGRFVTIGGEKTYI